MLRRRGLLSRPDGCRLLATAAFRTAPPPPTGEQVLTLVPGTRIVDTPTVGGGGAPLPPPAPAPVPDVPHPDPAREHPPPSPATHPAPAPVPPRRPPQPSPAPRRSNPAPTVSRVGPIPPRRRIVSHPVSRRLVLPPERRPETPIPDSDPRGVTSGGAGSRHPARAGNQGCPRLVEFQRPRAGNAGQCGDFAGRRRRKRRLCQLPRRRF